MRKTITLMVSLLALFVLYMLAWPLPVDPRAWVAPATPGYAEEFSANNRLASLRIIPLGNEEGPEHVALGPDGKLYATVASGNILRMNRDGSGQEVFATTGGRVLGFDFDANGNLIAADAVRGLLSISPSRQVSGLLNQIDGAIVHFLDAVVVAANGKIYMSEASTRFAPSEWGGTFEASVLDIMEQSATGRILEFDPATKLTTVIAKGLSFANGLALSQDQQFIFVAETGKYRIWKLPLMAKNLDLLATERGPLTKVVFDNLPGYPDNLMRGMDGRIWVGLVKPRSPTVDSLADKPFLRKLTLRLPRMLWPVPQAYGHVFAFKEDGTVVTSLQDPTGAYPETTGATESADRIYIQSLHAKGLGWLPK